MTTQWAKLFIVILALICFGSLVQATETIIFNDDFSSGSLAGWDQNAGTWSAATNQLVGGALDGSAISHTAVMTPGKTYRFYYKNDPSVAGLNNEFFWFTDQNGIADINGYSLVIQSSTTVLRRYINGSSTVLFSGAGVATGSLHDINITHTYHGIITLYVDGVQKTSVTDTTYQEGTRIGFSTSNGAGDGVWDDVNILFTGDTNETLRIVDEVTNTGIDANVTINNQSFPVGADGTFDINSDVVFPITLVASSANYDTRMFYYDSNQSLFEYNRIGLRTDTQANDIVFQFYAPDQLTKLTNRTINVTRGIVLSGKNSTDSDGIVTFNLAPQDNNYAFDIFNLGTTFGDANIEYNYSTVLVTVNAPRLEKDNNVASSPSGFNINIGGLGLQSISGQTSFPFSTIYILGNTQDAYTFRIIDNNSDAQQYFARNYLLHTVGDTSSISLTPYLISIIDGTLVNAQVIDTSSNITIPGLRFTLTSGIGNSVVTVEDTLTDSTGIAQIVMLSQKQYNFSITNIPQDINYFSGTISAVSDQISFFINYTSTDSNFTPKNIGFSISPTTDTLTGTTQQIDFNISADFTYKQVIVQAIDNNTIITSTSSTSNPFNSNITITLADFNSGQANIRFTIISADTNTIITKTYNVISVGNGGILNLIGLRQNLNPNNFLFIAVFALMGLIAVMGQGVLGNNDSQVIVAGIGMGIIVFLFFREYLLYAIGMLLAGAVAWLWVRVNR